MRDYDKTSGPMQATSRATLLDELMDCCVPKSEREHAAAREIERLRAEIAALDADARRYRFIRNNPWGPDLINVIQMQMNGKWDAAIDAAMNESR